MQKKDDVKAVDTAKTAKTAKAAKAVKEVVATKVEEAKEATKEAKEATKEVVKKAAAKKPAAPKKTAAKKPAVKEAAKTQVIVQYQNNEVDLEKIEERVKAQFVSEGHKAGTIKQINVYVKPEEYSAYFVIIEKFSGRVDLF